MQCHPERERHGFHQNDDRNTFLTFSEVSSYQNGPLKVGVDAAEHQFAHDGGDGGEHEGSAQDPCGRHVISEWTGLCRDPRDGTTNTCTQHNMILKTFTLL